MPNNLFNLTQSFSNISNNCISLVSSGICQEFPQHNTPINTSWNSSNLRNRSVMFAHNCRYETYFDIVLDSAFGSKEL